MNRPPSQRGSAIMLLFIAIALFGMVTFAFMRGSGNSTAMMTDEQIKVATQEMISYGSDIRTAIKRLKLRGCKDTEISFQSPSAQDPTWYENTFSPSDKRCHVFDINGGGLVWKMPPSPFSNPATTGYGLFAVDKYGFVTGTEWAGFKTTCGTSSCSDIIMMLGSTKFNQNICEKINRHSGISGNIEETISGVPYKGTIAVSTITFADEPGSIIAQGKSPVCFKVASSNLYIFMYMLLEQ